MSDLYRETMLKTMDVGASLAKWVLTSLLAINGGAAIATWGLQMSPGSKVASCAVFVVGVLLALLSAHLSVKSLPERMVPIGQAIGYWISVKYDGERVADLETHEINIGSVNKAASRGPEAVSWLSALAFVIGVALAGWGALPHNASTIIEGSKTGTPLRVASPPIEPAAIRPPSQ
ncbi:hypothetical protein [Novosphingobium ginsenosidimutans]|uniref:Uncharacterized protein n=2 Tax=Novosphingobium ginsenosidimutans TaxID=1176536 RepID=A0A5B8S4L6_9SPHN|nr:hypothetical protein [Novosphingobium ginsenosidimutans]QEA16058.1 hypothetical protein FRF71_07880 [Novosphingobium ginsenosidimutans]